MRFSAKSWLQKPAFLMHSSIWFQPENHLRSQEKQSHSCLLPQLCFIFESPAYPAGPDLHCPFIKASYSKCLFIYVQKFPVRQTSFMLNLKTGDGGGVLNSSRAICLTWPLVKIKHNNVSQSHSERWRSQENRSCLSQLLSFSALNYGSYYLLTGFSTLRARSKHSKSSRSLLQRTDRQMRERKICPEATVTSSSTFDLKGQMFSQPSADSCHLLSHACSPALLHLCALLCWIKLPGFHGKDVPCATKPLQGGLFQEDIGFVFRRTLLPACPASMWSISRPENITDSFTDLATLKQISLELSAKNVCLDLSCWDPKAGLKPLQASWVVSTYPVENATLFYTLFSGLILQELTGAEEKTL